MKHWLLALIALLWLENAQAVEVKHSENLMVGTTKVMVGYSEFPLQAERSFDFTFAMQNGIAGQQGKIEFVQPNGETYFSTKLPRYTRDRTIWGFDNIAIPTQGTWRMELEINGARATLPLEVGARPAGPPNNLITFLAILPMLALLLLAIRAWSQVRPMRHIESRTW